MDIYQLPNFNKRKIKKRIAKIKENKFVIMGVFVILVYFFLGFSSSVISKETFINPVKTFFQGVKINLPDHISIFGGEKIQENAYTTQITYEQLIINAVKDSSPSVVSIVISKNVPVYEEFYINPFGDLAPNIQIPELRQNGTEKKDVGEGSGFIVSEDGLILTNKHVVSDKKAEYTVFTSDGKKFKAKVLAKDPVQDLAIIKIENSEKFVPIKLGDSSGIQIGQTAIAIGNALGEFRNTVSVGVISGLGRTILATGSNSFSETLEDIIQTDAAINLGNSGGPLLNLKGEVIGINTAIAEGAQAIGFAIPINRAKRDIEQVSKGDKIVYPFLGVRYVLIDEDMAKRNKLSVDYGAWVKKGNNGEVAVTKGSSAEKAGIKAGDIILELNNQKITQGNSMATMILEYNAGDTISLKILRDGEEIMVDVVLGERS